MKLDEKAAYAIAKGADGGMRDAQSMLDQLVAFCGGEIHEEDVLEIFGFTAAESVAELAQSILSLDTVGALRVVHQQNEAGKDLGRFLSDLIQHIRTLLVQQADPEAAAEDLSPEVGALVVSQAQMASTEQLLRVVDGLGEVDARMRWASNKRLHFELGVIQAVQCMSEVSLSEVIEAIDRGAGGGPAVVAKRSAQPVAAAAVVKPAPVVQAKPLAQAAPSPVVEARVREDAAPVIHSATPAASSGLPAAANPVNAANLWSAVLEEVQKNRPLLVHWVEMGQQLEYKPGVLKVGYPTSEVSACESLKRDDKRKFLEGLLADMTGATTRLDLVIDSSLTAPAQPEATLFLDTPPAAKPAAKETAEPAATEAPNPAADPDFYNDPLITATIEAFKARIITTH